MKKILLTFLLISLMCVPAFARGYYSTRSSGGYHSVRGYTRSNGTYVAPHYQTNPNHTKLDNWSTKGNYNPFTGKAGTVNP